MDTALGYRSWLQKQQHRNLCKNNIVCFNQFVLREYWYLYYYDHGMNRNKWQVTLKDLQRLPFSSIDHDYCLSRGQWGTNRWEHILLCYLSTRVSPSSQRHTLPICGYMHPISEVIILNNDQHQHQKMISTNNRINWRIRLQQTTVVNWFYDLWWVLFQ